MIVASIVLIILALMGVPLFLIIAASAILGFISSEVDLIVIAIEFYRIVDMPALLSIPLFTLAVSSLRIFYRINRCIRCHHCCFRRLDVSSIEAGWIQ